MRALVGYTVARCSRAQVWVAPWLAFAVGASLLDASSGRAPDALALNGVVLLFVAAWLTLTTLGSQAAEQSAVLAAAVGGARRERLGSLLAAVVGGLALVPVSFVVAWFASRDPAHPGSPAHGLTVALAVSAVLGHVVACLCGTVVAGTLSRPLVTSRTVSLLLLLVVAVLLVVVPHAPVAVAVDRTGHPDAGGIANVVVLAAVTCAVVVVGGALAWWSAGLAARRR